MKRAKEARPPIPGTLCPSASLGCSWRELPASGDSGIPSLPLPAPPGLQVSISPAVFFSDPGFKCVGATARRKQKPAGSLLLARPQAYRARPASPCCVQEGGRLDCGHRPPATLKPQLHRQGRPAGGQSRGRGKPAPVRARSCSLESLFRRPQPWGQGWCNDDKTTFAQRFRLQSTFSGVGGAGVAGGARAARPRPPVGLTSPPPPGPARDRVRGRQSAIHPAVSESSGVGPFPSLP